MERVGILERRRGARVHGDNLVEERGEGGAALVEWAGVPGFEDVDRVYGGKWPRSCRAPTSGIG